ELEGMSWHLKPPEQTSVRVPSRVAVNERQRSWERWSTLREPSGKWDYYVKYDAPQDTTLIEEIATTGWGDEFSDNEVTPGKVTILEERMIGMNDETIVQKGFLSYKKDLHKISKNFLMNTYHNGMNISRHKEDQKQELESEWENPFVAKRGENHTNFFTSF
ncbi:hypothetical protein Tco_1093579, partial [Tanacetum coccineum]